MSEFLYLLRLKYWVIKNSLITLVRDSKFKTTVIFTAAISLWISMYKLFSLGYQFLGYFPDVGVDFITRHLFSILFLALTGMLVISNAIISFSGFYRARETATFISYPLPAGTIFSYKLLESLGFSSWAFVFLVIPLLFAYGVNQHLALSFYPLTVLFVALYIFIPAGLGALIALLIAVLFPQRKKEIIWLLILIIVGVIFVLFSRLAGLRGLAAPFTNRWMEGLLGQFSFAQNPLLPSYWLVDGLMAGARLDTNRTIFFLLFILAQALFVLLLVLAVARRTYLAGYSRLQSVLTRKKQIISRWFDLVVETLTFFLKAPLRQIILKDIKSLIRDPVQWSQSLIFFGLLGVYFLNLRHLPYLNPSEQLWQYLSSFLNLLATALTLATFTTRFVYPQLSLEGQRFWVIGLAPISRKTIIYGKFFFATLSSFIISEALILISNIMLKTPWYYTLVQAYTIFIICFGLSALAVGLGTVYPNLREDNPSRIVAGFGGTLTLILSMIFVLLVIAIEAAPPHLYYFFHRLTQQDLNLWWLASTMAITLVGGLTVYISLASGLKAIEKMEI